MALQASRDEIPALNIDGVCLHLGSVLWEKKRGFHILDLVVTNVWSWYWNLPAQRFDQGFQMCFLS